MRIAVTGATGFIGPYMLRGFLDAGHEVVALARPGREEAVFQPETGDRKVEVFTGDLTVEGSLDGFLKGVDVLMHMAACHDHVDDETMQKVTVQGTEFLLQEAEKNSPEMKFWVMSSAVIGAPVYSYYRDAKRVQEKLIKGRDFDWVSFRPTLVYGVGDYRHTAPLLRRCAQQGGSMWIPHKGNSKINPVHVEDVVKAVIAYFDFDRGIDCMYELAGPSGLTYNDFIDLTIEATGGTIKRRNISRKWIDRALFFVGLFKDTTKYRRASAYFTLHHEHDISNAVHELDWQPRTYAEGIREVAQGDWWRE